MVIVIGGTGLVGSHLLCELAKTESAIHASYQTKAKIKKVKALFDYYFGSEAEANWQKITWVQVSINDLVSLEDLISPGDEVYHCAALVSFNRNDFNRLMKINREGTSNVVNVCLDKKIKKLAYVSSTSAISGGNEKEVSEKTKWKKSDDTSAYSISKYGAEREVWRAINEGLSAVIVNPSVILGAGDWKESSLTILQQMKKGLSFYPPGSNAIVDARDVATCLRELMKSDIEEERFLLIGENVTFKTLFDKIAARMGKKPPKIAVGYVGLTIARLLMQFFSFLLFRKTPITAETVNSSLSSTVYANEKIKTAIGHRFYSLEETIDNAVKGKIN
ncbi:MAG: NAD-dependent epimerase/dehydratase family protein [Crocinitomicaceae bacterium]